MSNISTALYPALIDSSPVVFHSQNLVSELAQSQSLPTDWRGRFCQCVWIKDRIPTACASESRSLLECILKKICTREKLLKKGQSMELWNLIGLCMKCSAVPQPIIDQTLTVRNSGNTGAHDDDYSLVKAAHVEPCVLALANILDWYKEKYL